MRRTTSRSNFFVRFANCLTVNGPAKPASPPISPDLTNLCDVKGREARPLVVRDRKTAPRARGDRDPTAMADQDMTCAPRWTIGPLLPSGLDSLRAAAERLVRALRVLGLSGLVLFTDLAVFTLLFSHNTNPFAARAIAMVATTFLIWRLDRALPFGPTGNRPGDDAMRYVVVKMAAQGTSYATFTLLALTVCTLVPEVALIAGAGLGAIVAYGGHRSVAFAPRKLAHVAQS